MKYPITLDALEVLDAIDRKGSFAAAANELFRVPSAISYISRLISFRSFFILDAIQINIA